MNCLNLSFSKTTRLLFFLFCSSFLNSLSAQVITSSNVFLSREDKNGVWSAFPYKSDTIIKQDGFTYIYGRGSGMGSFTHQYGAITDYRNFYLLKLSPSNNIVYSARFEFGIEKISVVDGEVFALCEDASGYFNTGSPSSSRSALAKIDASGNLNYIHLATANSTIQNQYNDIYEHNGELYFTGQQTNTIDNSRRTVYGKLDASGQLVFENIIGPGSTYGYKIIVSNSTAYFIGFTEASTVDLPLLVAGTNSNPNSIGIMVGAFETNSGNLLFQRRFCDYTFAFASFGQGDNLDLLIHNGNALIVGSGLFFGNFPTTDNSTESEIVSVIVSEINASAQLVYSSIQSSFEKVLVDAVLLENNDVYITGKNGEFFEYNTFLCKFSIGMPQSTQQMYFFQTDGQERNVPAIRADQTHIYLAGTTTSSNFPGAPAYTNFFAERCYITKINKSDITDFSSAVLAYSDFSYDNLFDFQINECAIHLLGSTTGSNFPVTQTIQGIAPTFFSSTPIGFYTSFSKDLKLESSMFFTDPSRYFFEPKLFVDGSIVHAVGHIIASDFFGNAAFSVTKHPLTVPPPSPGADYTFSTMIETCNSASYVVPSGGLGNDHQEVCQQSTVQSLMGQAVKIPVQNMPQLYVGGTQINQPEVEAIYQWQYATSASGPWIDIPLATGRSFSPAAGNTSTYYRRLAYTRGCCPKIMLGTPLTAEVIVGPHVAPTVEAGGPYVTCPGSPIIIGGSPTVTGGNNPQISWDFGAGSLANPTVSPSATTVYTLTVTDDHNCVAYDQALVNVVQTNAGNDFFQCEGNHTVLNGIPFPGVNGVSYSWSPSGSLSNANSLQAIVNSTSSQTYTLTSTITNSAGVSCSTSDDVQLTYINKPATANFAGPDKADCFNNEITLGGIADPDYFYVWSPAQYLWNPYDVNSTFWAPSYGFPASPNPSVLTLTANKETCSFTDQMTVTLIHAEAGEDGCGPRTIGDPDLLVPGVNITFEWTVLSGEDKIVSGRNSPVAEVGASSVDTYYQLTASYTPPGGPTVSCTDVVWVPSCLCNVDIVVNSPNGCAKYVGSEIELNAIVTGAPAGSHLEWFPASGLSTNIGSTVYLNDYTIRTYTVKLIAYDGTVLCSESLPVNQVNMIIPQFTANGGTGCAGEAVQIGGPINPNYIYAWSPENLLNDANLSNPTATSTYDLNFNLRVTQAGAGGCYTDYTVPFDVTDVLVNAGADQILCGSGTVTLGSSPEPGYTYSWFPANANYVNGTSPTSPEAQLFIAENLVFTLTATDPVSGCSQSDEVSISVVDQAEIDDVPDMTICAGQSVQMPLNALPGVQYHWEPSTGLSCSDCPNPVASPSTTTNYTVTATFVGDCQPVSDQVTINVNQTIAFTLPTLNVCPSETNIQLGAGSPTGYPFYQWDFAPNLLNTNQQYAVLSEAPKAPTTYTLNFRDANNCVSSGVQSVVPNQFPPVSPNFINVCAGETVNIGSDQNPISGYTYSWSPISGVANPSSPSTTFTANGFAGDVFYLTLTQTSDAGCVTSTEVQINIRGAYANEFERIFACSGDELNIGLFSLPAGTNFAWTSQPVVDMSAFTSYNVTFEPSVSANYTLTLVDQYGCEVKSTYQIFVSDGVRPEIVLESVNACLEAGSVVLNPSVSPAASYIYFWSTSQFGPENYGQAIQTQDLSNPTYLYGATGGYSVYLTVTNADNGCSGNAYGSISVNDCPGPCEVSLQVPEFACTATDFRATALTNPPGGNLVWTGSNATSSTVNFGPVSENMTISVSYTALDGCVATETVEVPLNEDCCPAPELDCPDVTLTSNYICDRLYSNDLSQPGILNPCAYYDISDYSFTHDANGIKFPIGVSEVNWTVTSPEGDVSTCVQKVTLQLSVSID